MYCYQFIESCMSIFQLYAFCKIFIQMIMRAILRPKNSGWHSVIVDQSMLGGGGGAKNY